MCSSLRTWVVGARGDYDSRVRLNSNWDSTNILLKTTTVSTLARRSISKRSGLTAMLGTAVSGRSIIVLCCHHPACNGQSPRHKPINVQRNDSAERNTQLSSFKTAVCCKQKEAKCVRKWMNEVKLHMAAEYTTTRCSSVTKNAPTVFLTRQTIIIYTLEHPGENFRIRRNSCILFCTGK